MKGHLQSELFVPHRVERVWFDGGCADVSGRQHVPRSLFAGFPLEALSKFLEGTFPSGLST